VLITAFLVPAIAISIKLTGQPLPQVGMGSQVLADIDPVQPYLLDKLNQINHDFGFGSYTDTFVSEKWNKLNVFCVALALMAGTAGLPHVIIRFYTVRTVKAARWSAFWALTFIALLYLTAPATAAFARYYMLDTTAGLNGKTAEQLPDWYQSWSKSGLIAWFDFNGDGRVQMHNDPTINEVMKVDTVRDAEAAKAIKDDPNAWVLANGGEAAREKLVALGGVHQPDIDIIVLATPEMAGLADWIIALIAAGGLAAALSTASGLLLVISSSVAHDLYYRVIDTKASEKKRLLVGRIVIGFAVVVAGYFGVNPPGFVGEVVAFAFGLAAASFFPIIVLGIFSKRVGTVPAITGMVLGIAFTAFYIFTQTAAKIVGPDLANAILGAVVYDDGTKNWLRTQWCFGINAQGIGTLGMLLNFVVTLALTPLFPPPSQATQDLVDSVREPEGAGPGLDIEAAPGH
jgi:cation/acetate symporter